MRLSHLLEPRQLILPHRKVLCVSPSLLCFPDLFLVSADYNLVHAGNTETIEGVAPLLLATKPTPQLLVRPSPVSLSQADSGIVLRKHVDAGTAGGDSEDREGDGSGHQDGGDSDGDAGR